MRNCIMLFSLMLIAAVLVSGSECEALDDWGAQLEQWQKELTPPPGLDGKCLGEAAPPAVRSGVCKGDPITGFFSFGCRLNYRLLNWVLSDKCANSGTPEAFP